MSIGPPTCPSQVRSGPGQPACPRCRRERPTGHPRDRSSGQQPRHPDPDAFGGAVVAAGTSEQEGLLVDKFPTPVLEPVASPASDPAPPGPLSPARGAGRPWPNRRRYRRASRRRTIADCGAGAAEAVLAVPFLMLLILLIVQFAVAQNAYAVAQNAAEEALAAARVQGGTAAAGQQRADQVLAQIGGTLTGAKVTVSRTADTVTVEISGTADQVLPVPGLSFTVTATASGPVERFIPFAGG
jgi:hypothetical protein